MSASRVPKHAKVKSGHCPAHSRDASSQSPTGVIPEEVGASYDDLGATIDGPQQDLNLGIQAIVDDGATTTIRAIEIDTSRPGTHTIEYVATDQNGLQGTATRTVTVVAAPDSGVASSTNSISTTAATSSAE